MNNVATAREVLVNKARRALRAARAKGYGALDAVNFARNVLDCTCGRNLGPAAILGIVLDARKAEAA